MNTPLVVSRNSSIELYRILAILAVIIGHFNVWFVGGMPESFDFVNITVAHVGQPLIAAFSCICVNMFIIISGYFGLKLKMSSLSRICLMLAFIYIPAYLLSFMCYGDFSLSKFIGHFFVVSRAGYFIQCYLMLMFLSPVLNSFVEKYGKRILIWCLFFVFIEFWWGCIMTDTVGLADNLFINQGYSLVHFVLIYLLARCVRFYKDTILSVKKTWFLLFYFLSSITIFCMFVCGVKFAYNYSNPIVIVSSFFTFFPFMGCTYHNKIVNWIAKDTLAVYVIQVTPPVLTFLMWIDTFLLERYSYGLYWFLCLGVIFVFFFFSVIYSKFCNLLINPIVSYIDEKFNFRFLE